MFKTLFLKKVLSWIAGIDWTQFLQIVGIVKKAAELYPHGSVESPGEKQAVNLNRALYVSQKIADLLKVGNAASNVITVVREIAVWYSRRA